MMMMMMMMMMVMIVMTISTYWIRLLYVMKNQVYIQSREGKLPLI